MNALASSVDMPDRSRASISTAVGLGVAVQQVQQAKRQARPSHRRSTMLLGRGSQQLPQPPTPIPLDDANLMLLDIRELGPSEGEHRSLIHVHGQHIVGEEAGALGNEMGRDGALAGS